MERTSHRETRKLLNVLVRFTMSTRTSVPIDTWGCLGSIGPELPSRWGSNRVRRSRERCERRERERLAGAILR
jgi:hypothetical protein